MLTHLQVSGQGPYFGQKAWFTFFHHEKPIRSAIDRYAAEIRRVVGVLDKHLKDNGTGWLVGDKCTYADLSFVPWDMMLTFLMGEEAVRIQERYPDFTRWHGKFDWEAHPRQAESVMMCTHELTRLCRDHDEAPGSREDCPGQTEGVQPLSDHNIDNILTSIFPAHID